MARRKAAATPPKPSARATARDLALEDKLLANPDDPDTRAVFADWLQAQGDPWGELIAFALAGKTKQAKGVLRKHGAVLRGGFPAAMFEWRSGFIDTVRLRADDTASLETLEQVFALHTTLLTRRLLFPIELDDTLAAAVSRCAPRTLQSLFCWLSDGVGGLELPALEELTIYKVRKTRFELEGVRRLFSAVAVPKLRYLELLEPMPVAVIEELLDSRLLRQLDSLKLGQGATSVGAAELLLERKDALAHIPRFTADAPTTLAGRFADTFGPQTTAWTQASRERDRVPKPEI